MADSNQRVMDLVRREIAKNPGVSSEALFAKAKKVDSSLGRLSTRQFHAKYPLQVKRALKRAGDRAKAAIPVKKTRGPGKRGPGRPRKITTKRGPGRPRKITTKRGPGRPRKSTTQGVPGRRPGRPPGSGASSVSTPAAASSSSRDAVRALLLQFASDVAGAPGKPEVVKVLTSVDRLVDRLIQAAR
jgi:hypothetical protein